ncbi:MAG: CPBP family intramembrane metalloprotease [Aureispira sp.]|nr:CPBP family intramembrane metalloprotease [Aureispira sp.]
MDQVDNYKKVGINWQIGEFVVGIIALAYFLMYPRDTLSDFLVLTVLCFILRLSYTQIGLLRLPVCPFSKADTLLVIFTIIIFLSAWIYGAIEGTLNRQRILMSLFITVVYFYYAFIQHFLAQRYLALRLFYAVENKAFILRYKFRKKIIAALLTGFIFGVIHLPYPDLILPSMIGGALYAYYFLTTGKLWMVVSSHALISSTVLFWYLGDNPFVELEVFFS